jgi:hypothetical protein
MPPCNILQPPSQATPTQVSPTSTQAQDFDGPITCSRAKKPTTRGARATL